MNPRAEQNSSGFWKCIKCGDRCAVSGFYYRANGYRIQPCKGCMKKRDRKLPEEQRAKHAALQRDRYRENPSKYKAINARSRKNNPSASVAGNARWNERNKERVKKIQRGQGAIKRAIRKGIIHRPSFCENCGSNASRIEAAHFNYVEILKVRWLCVPCHRRWDMEVPKTK